MEGTRTVSPRRCWYRRVSLADLDTAIRRWEDAAGATIFGAGSPATDPLSADTSSTDGRNEIYFAPVADANVLGFTIVWSTRRGRQIVEADMVIDTDWTWSTAHESQGIGEGDFHFWSVLVHEAGHYAGMGHTDTSSLCSAQTMFPSIAAGDASKESLGEGDVAGIRDLY